MLKRNTLAPNTRVRLSGFFWFRRLKPTVTDRLCMVPSSEKVVSPENMEFVIQLLLSKDDGANFFELRDTD